MLNRIKSSICIVLTLILLVAVYTTPMNVVNALPQDQKVYDEHDLFSADEELLLEETLSKLSEEAKTDILILTSSSTNGLSRQVYLENFYDENGPGYDGEFGSATLMLLNMDSSDRGVEIQGYGTAEYNVNNQRIMNIISDIKPNLSAGNYYDAVIDYGNQVVTYMNSEPSSSSNNGNNSNYNNNYNNSNNNYNSGQPYEEESLLTNPLVQLVISLIIGAVVVGIMAANSGGKTTTTSSTYLDSSKVYIPVQRDTYLRTSVTKVKKPENNNHNSGGGGGTSSGGRSHSGGGSSF